MSNPASTPAGRATQAREALQRARDEWNGGTLRGAIPYVDALKLIPEGSIILTAEEAEQVLRPLRCLAWRQIPERNREHVERLAVEALVLLAGGRNPA